jgi:hypothetical protein
MKRIASVGLVLVWTGLVVVLPVLAQQDYGFMPKGGKTLLTQLLGKTPGADELRQITSARRSEAEWREALSPRTGELTEKEARTVAAYAAVNLPLATGALERAQQQGEWTAALPPDGRELAWNNCQFCHSLFSSYLTIERNVQGWTNTFQTPFHREIKMTAQERETFARYSAINMPMRVEDVPPELRF